MSYKIEDTIISEVNNDLNKLHELTEMLNVHTTDQVKNILAFADLYRKLIASGVITESKEH